MRYKLDKFIHGETINLNIPNINFAKKSNWYKFFNSDKNTKFLDHGVFPNTADKQIKFFSNIKNDNRLVLIICDKDENFIGVINLSSINYEKLSADISLILNQDSSIGSTPKNFLSALEAIALMTEHGFEKLGLNRISAGQCINLNKWQNIMELTGYKIEGVHKDKFVKGMIISDVMTISCSKNDYLYLKKKRGKLWDNKNNMLKRIKKLPKVTALKKIKDQLKFLDNQYYKKIFNLQNEKEI